MPDRAATFERLIEDYDEKKLPSVLDFKQHRFVSVERDSVTVTTVIRGHKSLRGACNYLADVIAGAERFVPEKIIDLDSGELHELDVFAFVAPKSVDAVAVMLPRDSAELVAEAMRKFEFGARLQKLHDQTTALIQKALDRRS